MVQSLKFWGFPYNKSQRLLPLLKKKTFRRASNFFVRYSLIYSQRKLNKIKTTRLKNKIGIIVFLTWEKNDV